MLATVLSLCTYPALASRCNLSFGMQRCTSVVKAHVFLPTFLTDYIMMVRMQMLHNIFTTSNCRLVVIQCKIEYLC